MKENHPIQYEVDRLFKQVRYWPRGLLFKSKAHRTFLMSIQQHINVDHGNRCLDLGCGTEARYKPLIEALKLEWYGADLFPSNALKEHNYLRVENNLLGFDNDFFDIICTFNVIEHFTHPEDLFKEISRCLRLNGILCGAVAFWEMEHDSYFHLTYKGLSEILKRNGFELLALQPSEYSGMVLNAQRFFGGNGKILKTSRKVWFYSLLCCNINWIPFLFVCLLEQTRRLLLKSIRDPLKNKPLHDPLKNCATLYFFARKIS